MDLVLELTWGENATREWAARCVAPLRSLCSLAAQLDDRSIEEALHGLLSVLEKADEKAPSSIEDELRGEVLRAYAALGEKVPAAIDPGAERGRRDPAIVDALLLQVEGVHDVAIQRVYAAGWNVVDRFVRTTPEELDRETGIGLDLAERIVTMFRGFRTEFPTWAPDPLRSDETQRVSSLLGELRMQQKAFERAVAGFSDQDLSARRVLRKDRARTLRQIYALLARMGEVERIAKLDRLPYQARITELTTYLRSDAASTASVS